MAKKSGWLPTPEEIKEYCNKYEHMAPLFSFDFSKGVTFEAKKIEERLNSMCLDNLHYRGFRQPRWDCPDCRRELQKEIEGS